MAFFEPKSVVEAVKVIESNKQQIKEFLKRHGVKLCADCGGVCLVNKDGTNLPVNEDCYIAAVDGEVFICSIASFDMVFKEVIVDVPSQEIMKHFFPGQS